MAVHPGDPIPTRWEGASKVHITTAALRSTETLMKIRTAYLKRTPVVYEIDRNLKAIDVASEPGEPWKLDVTFEFVTETAWELLWRNTVDLRDGTPRWPLADRAVELGAALIGTGEGDVRLPDGRLAWCDGGPLNLNLGKDFDGSVIVATESIEQESLDPIDIQGCEAELAADQLGAVTEPGMRARIIAPAGSGKTRVLTERARLLIRSGVPPESLLLVAFNNRAREEMQNRTTDLPDLQVLTLNALGLAIVNGTRGFANTGASRSTLKDNEVSRLIKEMADIPRTRNADPVSSWVEALSTVRLGLQDPQKVEASYGGEIDGFASFFPRYRAKLESLQLLDFDEMIYGAIELMLSDPRLRAQNQKRARVVLADEFQDLNPAHILLLRLLSEPGLGVFGVGDDDQTIYGYSGASPEWLVRFNDFVPGSQHHALQVNYRCPAPVVRAAANLLTRNRVRVTKKIVPGARNLTEPDRLRVISAQSATKPTIAAVKECLDIGSAPEDVVVLSRVNALLQPVAVGLRALGIPVNSEKGPRFLEGSGVKAALAWFSLGTTKESLRSSDIDVALQRPSRGMNLKTREWVAKQRTVTELADMTQKLDDPRTARSVKAFAHDLSALRSLSTSATSQEIIRYIRSEIALDASMAALDKSREGKNKSGHLDDLRALEDLASLHPQSESFVSWLRVAINAPSVATGVTLSSIHRVKGLEWPHVFLHDASAGVMPHRLSNDREEERRVFHVAITRAQETLTITFEDGAPSPFIGELNAPGSPEVQAASPPRRTEAPPRQGREVRRPNPQPVKRTPGSNRFVLKVGDSFSKGGADYVVTEVTSRGVNAKIGKVSTEIRFGESLTVSGKTGKLAKGVD